ARAVEGGPDVAGSDETDAGELEREDMVQPADGQRPSDDELQADVIERLRASDVPAGDHLRVAVSGAQVMLAGQVESVDVLDEILGIVGDVPGVDEVVDEVEIAGV
ncbi:MAG TPA: BON domain-containing protein, partial [Candidatus Limnocylindria bacterium]|nr:BON domain-containing protein [Candidatus Limnocylindria bacterium]